MGLDEERRRNLGKGMAELERRREAIRQREEAERQVGASVWGIIYI